MARRDKKRIYLHEGAPIRKVTDIAYKMDRMNMSAERRRKLAGANMQARLNQKYGAGWEQKLAYEFWEGGK
jgi:hypothetical protein